MAFGLALAGPGLAAEPVTAPSLADALASVEVSADARRITAWVLETADNQGLPFLIVDKTHARVLAYDPAGRLLGTAPVLLGLAEGDISPPGIGDRPLSAITPAERITPAGRFIASLGQNLAGKSILWIDYESALSLHPVVTTRAGERRAQRLATDTPTDNRISWGCVNVPAEFYRDIVHPAFDGAPGVVYILPEHRSLAEVFFPPAG
ncbi:MAG: L,D-transpeptidase [Alphaproteobacteria bacterium]|nr:L,D-transpeptidase [Alphaproteobacteria bacterium]MBU2269952.1 L,D-transpeptidase [Alphaproteobacteria bacterium]MBU2418441.1 L,D-transpeptidase [Alphaproteobacteria bacterium]